MKPARTETLVPQTEPRPQALVRQPATGDNVLAYLKLRSEILVGAPRVRTIGVLSARAGRQRSTAALQIARSLGQGRERTVLVVDGDLKGGTLTKMVARGRDGKTEQVCGDEYRLFTGIAEGVDALTPAAAPRPDRPHDPLIWRDLLDELACQYGYVIVDCPPMLDQPDAFVVRDAVDALVVVAVAGRTRLAELAHIVEGRTDAILAVLLQG